MKITVSLLFASLLLVHASGASVVDESYGAARDASNDNIQTETCVLKDDNSGECEHPDAAAAAAAAKANTTSSSNNSTTGTSFCLDDREECPQYAARGDCERNPKYMLSHCKASCNACPANLKIFDAAWGENQESYGEKAAEIEKVVKATEKYMLTKVYKQSLYITVREDCLNRDKLCSKWAVEGECDKNPMWMTTHCGPACQTCEKIDHRIRCPFDEKAPKAWGPGSVDDMFMRLIKDPHYQQYQPKVLSRPPDELTSWVPAVYDSKLPDKDAPWVVELETFLTAEETDRLVYLGGLVGYKQSYEVGGKNFDGTYAAHDSEDRTSFNAWCFEKQCYEDKITQQILAKVENVTGIPEINSEFFQLLRYEEGGLYRKHSDYVPGDFSKSQGVRILTVFIYLNDLDEDAGGETAFPDLNLKITPKKGKAVLWPNVYMRNPDARDRRTQHEALPVKKGTKYAANLWLHQRDFKTPFFNLCN